MTQQSSKSRIPLKALLLTLLAIAAISASVAWFADGETSAQQVDRRSQVDAAPSVTTVAETSALATSITDALTSSQSATPASAPAVRMKVPLKTGVSTQSQALTSLKSFERMVRKRQDYYMYYLNWDYDVDTSLAAQLIAHKTTPILTWEPLGLDLDDINSGKRDAYIRRNAKILKRLDGRILVRPMHEMNGPWYTWGAERSNNTPAKYRAAFKRIVKIFRKAGATNVKFVWSPNVNGKPGGTARSIPWYYPGDAYVDYAALDGYNFGTAFSWARWKSFPTLFRKAYFKVTSVSNRPIIIAETGCVEKGGSKARWIRDTYTTIKRDYPRIHAVVWYHTKSQGVNYRVHTSKSSLTSFRREMARLGVR